MTNSNAVSANDTALSKAAPTTCVLTLETHNLNDADLYAFVVTLTDLCNSRKMTYAGCDDVLKLLTQAEDEFYRRKSVTPADALRKIVCLASDVIASEYRDGAALVADAQSVLDGLERVA